LTGNTRKKDAVFRDPQAHIVDFAFDETVASVFPDMVRRSVPGYETVIPLSGLLAARYIQENSRCYDLGCSLGATTLALLSQIGTTACEIVAVDKSAAMLEKAQSGREWDSRVSFIEADVCTLQIERASVVFMNYLLQFIAPDERLSLLQRIHGGLLPGGVLILSERLAGNDEFDAVHADFKRANGYSELEVSQKRTALENIMIPDTLEAHLARLELAGFSKATVWFRCLNWVSLLAVA